MARLALADPTNSAAPTPAPPAFHSVTTGAITDIGIGSSAVGDTLMGEAGIASSGIKSLRQGKWLWQWDVLFAFKGGELANAHPFLTLLGVHLHESTDLGYRLLPRAHLSPYIGAGLDGDIQVMAPPGVALSDLNMLNSMDGVGGANLSGAVRAAVGVSYLGLSRSFLLTIFAQESGRAAAINTPAAAFTDVGVALRFDIARSFLFSVEALWGRTTVNTNAALGLDDQTTHEQVSGTLRKIFANGMWLGATASIAVELDHLVYPASASVYDTVGPPIFGVAIHLGIPFGKQE